MKDGPKYQPIGLALLIYMVAIILLITLIPFQFYVPEHITFRWRLAPEDFIRNIILFIPLGFLFRQTCQHKSRRYGNALLFGFLLSLFIETSQSFVLSRFTSGYDLIANTTGTLLGAGCFDFLAAKVKGLQTGFSVPTLRIPLLFPVIMLMPLIWLTCLSAGQFRLKVYLLCPLSMFGIGLIRSIQVNRMISNPSEFRRIGFLPLAWLLLSTLPAIIQFPNETALVWIGMAALVGLLRFLPVKRVFISGRRFEVSSLKKLLPVYIVYLLLLVLLTGTALAGRADGYNKINAATILVEYIAAFTILGYAMFEMRGRMDKTPHKSGLIVFITCLLFIGLASLFKPFRFQNSYEMILVLSVICSALYGGLIYRLHLRLIR